VCLVHEASNRDAPGSQVDHEQDVIAHQASERRAGKGSGWISDRTSHLTIEMMQRYDRGARSLADLQMVPFPDIDTAILELQNVAPLRRQR